MNMIIRSQSRLIYLSVYKKLQRLKQDTISAEELSAMISYEHRLYGFKQDKAKVGYIVGFFKRNKVIVPDGYRLRISINEQGVRV